MYKKVQGAGYQLRPNPLNHFYYLLALPSLKLFQLLQPEIENDGVIFILFIIHIFKIIFF